MQSISCKCRQQIIEKRGKRVASQKLAQSREKSEQCRLFRSGTKVFEEKYAALML
jgi:hypothetical protein